MRIATRVEFDDGGAEAHRRLDLPRIGFDEQADADSRIVQPRDDRREVVMLSRRVEPPLGRTLLALFGDDARRMRIMAQRDCNHLVGGRHFEV